MGYIPRQNRFSSVLEAVSRASASPFSAERMGRESAESEMLCCQETRGTPLRTRGPRLVRPVRQSVEWRNLNKGGR